MSGAFIVESVDPIENIIELWDQKSYTAPGKQANEKATAWYWVPDASEFSKGDRADIIIRKYTPEPEQETSNDNDQ